MKRVINAFILGTLGFIFSFDVIAYVYHNDTISEQVTAWINQSIANLYIFLSIVVLFTVHMIFGKYKD